MMIAGGAAAVGVVLLAAIALPFFNHEPQPRAAVLSLTAADAQLQGIAEGVAEDASAALRAAGVDTLPRSSGSDTPREQLLDRARGSGAPFALELPLSAPTAMCASLFPWHAPRIALRFGLRRWKAQLLQRPLCASKPPRTASARSPAPYALAQARRSALTRCCSAPAHGAKIATRVVRTAKRSRKLSHKRLNSRLLALCSRQKTAASPTLRPNHNAKACAPKSATTPSARSGQDKSLGEAYLALARTEPRRRWDARERTLQQGLQEDERSSALSAEYSELLFEVGRFDDALAYARNASTLDPLSLHKRTAIASIVLQDGDIGSPRATSLIISARRGRTIRSLAAAPARGVLERHL